MSTSNDKLMQCPNKGSWFILIFIDVTILWDSGTMQVTVMLGITHRGAQSDSLDRLHVRKG